MPHSVLRSTGLRCMSFYEMDRTVQLTVNLECSLIHDTCSRADGTTDVNLECSLIHETWSRALRSYKRVESVTLWCETKPTASSMPTTSVTVLGAPGNSVHTVQLQDKETANRSQKNPLLCSPSPRETSINVQPIRLSNRFKSAGAIT